MTTDEREPTTFEIAAAPERSRARAIIVWLAIAVSMAIIAMQDSPSSDGTGNSNASALALRSAGRYAVGVNRISSKVAAGIPTAGNIPEALTTQLERAATLPADRLYLLPAIAELRGAEVVILRIDQLKLPDGDIELARDAHLLRVIYTDGPGGLQPAERQRLIRRMGWFGQLAVSWGLPDADPVRRAALDPAMRTAMGAFIAVPLVIIAGSAGFVLLIAAAFRWRAGKMTSAAAGSLADRSDSGFLVEAFALYLVSFVVIQACSRHFTGGPLPLLWTALYVLAPVSCLWPLTQGMRFRELRTRLGWHRGRGFFREAGWGVVGYIAGLPIVAAGVIVTLLLSQIGKQQPTHPISESITWDFWRVIALLALASIYAPFAEETMFRGAFFAGARGRWKFPASALVVAFVFAAIHPQGWTAIPVLMSLALVFALLREWRGSLIAPMTAHGLNNALVVLLFAMVAG